MKKLFVVFLFSVFLSILPCFAFDWVQVDDQGKQFIDISSIQKYNYKYNSGSEKGQYYSFWKKSLNNNSEGYKKFEKSIKKKIWYSMDKIVVNCGNEQFAFKSGVFYDVKEEPIINSSFENIDAMLDWQSIVPGTVGANWYNYVCSSQVNHEIPNSKNIPSNVKIKIKDGRSKHWSSI